MKKMINYTLMTLICLAFFGLNNLNAQDWTKDQKAVWQEIEAGWEAWKTGDSDGAFKGIHDSYLGWNNEDPMPMSKEKWMRQYNEMKENVTVNYYDIEPARINVDGNNAAVYYYFEFSMTYKKGEMEKDMNMDGRNVEFYVKDGGKWMLFGDMTYIDDDDD